MIKQVQVVSISDQQRARAFYVDALGFEDPPTERPWGTQAVFGDPEGNGLVLSGAPSVG